MEGLKDGAQQGGGPAKTSAGPQAHRPRGPAKMAPDTTEYALCQPKLV